MKEKISNLDIISGTAKDLNLEQKDVKKIVTRYLYNVESAIATGKPVEIRGLGTFIEKNSVLRNDKKLLEGDTPSGKNKRKHKYKTVGFIPSKTFKQHLTKAADKLFYS
ncbi:MAG: hypothetical protein HDS11_04210 [Bacteroides sp.]|nr:hypothetical protein [Bacteroides sp.]